MKASPNKVFARRVCTQLFMTLNARGSKEIKVNLAIIKQEFYLQEHVVIMSLVEGKAEICWLFMWIGALQK